MSGENHNNQSVLGMDSPKSDVDSSTPKIKTPTKHKNDTLIDLSTTLKTKTFTNKSRMGKEHSDLDVTPTSSYQRSTLRTPSQEIILEPLEEEKVSSQSTVQLLEQYNGHLKKRTANSLAEAEKYLDELTKRIHQQNTHLRSYKIDNLNSSLVQDLIFHLKDQPNKPQQIKAQIKSTVSTKDPNKHLKSNPTLIEVIQQMMKQIAKHERGSTEKAANYLNRGRQILQEREELIKDLEKSKQKEEEKQGNKKKKEGSQESVESSDEVLLLTPKEQRKGEKVRDEANKEDQVTEKASEEQPEKGNDNTISAEKQQVHIPPTLEENLILNNKEVHQPEHDKNTQTSQEDILTLRKEIEQLKKELNDKEDEISQLKLQQEPIKKTQQQESPLKLINNIKKNVQLLNIHKSTEEHHRNLIKDLTSNIDQLLTIIEKERNKILDIKEDYDKQQLYIESLHAERNSLNSVENKLEYMFQQQTKALIEQITNQQRQAVGTTHHSYADTLKFPQEKTLLVRKKDPNLTPKEMEKKINELGLDNLEIQDCAVTRSGNIQLRCQQDSAKKIEEKLQQSNLAEQMEIVTKTQRLIIFSIPQEITEEEIKAAINKKLNRETETKIIKKSQKSEFFHCTIELDINSASHLLSTRKLLLHFHSCPIRRYISLPRCYRCQGLGHFANQCNPNKEARCENCAGTHDSRSCTLKEEEEKHKCYNCIIQNQNTNTNYKINHKSSCNSCPTYLKKIKEKRTSTTNSR